MLDSIIISIPIVILGISFLILYYMKLKIDEKLNCIKNYDHFLAILNYHMEKAFDIIYKEKVLAYSLEAMKINENQFRTISRDFGVLVLKMIGPSLTNSFVSMYGNEETLLFNIMEYFNTRFENDEIYKTSSSMLLSSSDSAQNSFDETFWKPSPIPNLGNNNIL